MLASAVFRMIRAGMEKNDRAGTCHAEHSCLGGGSAQWHSPPAALTELSHPHSLAPNARDSLCSQHALLITDAVPTHTLPRRPQPPPRVLITKKAHQHPGNFRQRQTSHTSRYSLPPTSYSITTLRPVCPGRVDVKSGRMLVRWPPPHPRRTQSELNGFIRTVNNKC